MESLFKGNSVKSKRIIYTPSNFAKTNLLHLQEVGKLTAIKPHANSREGLNSFLFFVVTDGMGELMYDNKKYRLQKGDCAFIDCRKPYSHSSSKENLWSLQWVHFYGFNANGIYEKYTERGGLPAFTPKCSLDFSEVLKEIFNIAGSEDHIRDMKKAGTPKIQHTSEQKNSPCKMLRNILRNIIQKKFVLMIWQRSSILISSI